MKRVFFILMILTLIFGSAACTRSKTRVSEPASKGVEGGIPSEEEGNTVLNELVILVTQTYEASLGTVIPQPTTEPGGENLPTEEVTPNPEGQTGEATPVPIEQPTEAVQPTQAPIVAEWKPTPGIPATYVFQAGEFIYCIARRFNVNPDELMRLNGLSANSIIKAGLVIKLPQTGNKFPAGRSLIPHPDQYTVASGDTIYTIACAYGDVDPNGIIAVNGLKAPYNLTPGQKLLIP